MGVSSSIWVVSITNRELLSPLTPPLLLLHVLLTLVSLDMFSLLVMLTTHMLLDTPAVAAARAAHLGQLGHVLPVGYAYHPYAAGYPHGLVAHANGAVVPADTPDVYAAKVAHAAAGGVVNPVGVYGLAYAGLV